MPPNVLIWVADSLRADHVGCYGHKRNTTPRIDGLASEAWVFEQAFSQAIWTSPSSASIITGCYPPSHNAYQLNDRIPDSIPRAAKAFENNGYETVGVSTLDYVSSYRGHASGFKTFAEPFKDTDPTSLDGAREVADHFLGWFDQRDNPEKPFLYFGWSIGTHVPYNKRADEFSPKSTDVPISIPELQSASADDAKFIKDTYDDAIRYEDQQLGRVLDTLREAGIYDDTIVVVLSDHGEIFDEHGYMEQAGDFFQRTLSTVAPKLTTSKRLFDQYGFSGHQAILPYEELIHIPLIIKPPNSESENRVNGLVESIDIMPTIVDMAIDKDLGVDGQVIGPDHGGKSFVYSESPVKDGLTLDRSIRNEKWKLTTIDRLPIRGVSLKNIGLRDIFSIGRSVAIKDPVLFDVDSDEKYNYYMEEKPMGSELKQKIRDWVSECESNNWASEVAEDYSSSEVDERLSALGYK